MKKAAKAGGLSINGLESSDLVAKRAFDLALKLLTFALALLRNAFGFQLGIVGCAASGLLDVACEFVAKSFGFIG
jgi:hypothetical protein